MEPTREELETLRTRLETLEQERHEQLAHAHDALAAAQDRSYWLDRWGLDLNALMRRRGAPEALTALRALRLIAKRGAKAIGAVAELPDRVVQARRKAAREVERG